MFFPLPSGVVSDEGQKRGGGGGGSIRGFGEAAVCAVKELEGQQETQHAVKFEEAHAHRFRAGAFFKGLQTAEESDGSGSP